LQELEGSPRQGREDIYYLYSAQTDEDWSFHSNLESPFQIPELKTGEKMATELFTDFSPAFRLQCPQNFKSVRNFSSMLL
jgi:hypothetical protein